MTDRCDELSPHESTVLSLKAKMPEDAQFRGVATFFKALSDETRAKIIWALDQTELCGCDLAELLQMTPSAISHQLSGLKKERMVKARKAGKEVFYSLDDDHIRNMLESGMEHMKEG